MRRFVNGVLEPQFGSVAEELSGDRQRMMAHLCLGQFGRKFHRVQNLRQHWFGICVIATCQIEGIPFFPARAHGKEPFGNRTQSLHLLRRGDGIERQVALLAKTRDVLQEERGSTNSQRHKGSKERKVSCPVRRGVAIFPLSAPVCAFVVNPKRATTAVRFLAARCLLPIVGWACSGKRPPT